MILTSKAILRICGYVIAAGSFATPKFLSDTFRFNDTTTSTVLFYIGIIVGLATLIKSVVDSQKSEVPHGYENVITPKLETDVSDPILLSPPPPLLTTTDTVRKAAT